MVSEGHGSMNRQGRMNRSYLYAAMTYRPQNIGAAAAFFDKRLGK
jgi:hypothetical protein